MTGSKVGVAIVGAGVISKQYLDNLTSYPDIHVAGIADIDPQRASEKGTEYGIDATDDIKSMISRDDVEIVVNLTVPAAHTTVARQAVKAGKHVYNEKPLATDPVDGEKLLAEAAEAGLRVGCAPDTFLGAGFQSAQRAIAAGVIGEPLAAATATMNPGPDRWHPNPEFLFAAGAGPLFDIGPYPLTSLVALFGPVKQVAALSRKGRSERVVGSGPRQGTRFSVDVPTHVTALLDFVGGASAATTLSFDSANRRIEFEVTGTEGSLAVPFLGRSDGRLQVKAPGDTEWRDLPITGDVFRRGMGVLDMARAIRTGRPHRASGELAQHVLELMTAIDTAGRSGSYVDLTSVITPPEALPEAWDSHERTL